jgi:hypothetical protein
LQVQFPAGPLALDDEYLAPGDYSAAALAAALVVERVPVMELIEVTEEIEFIFRRELQRSGSDHGGSFASGAKFDNQGRNCLRHR